MKIVEMSFFFAIERNFLTFGALKSTFSELSGVFRRTIEHFWMMNQMKMVELSFFFAIERNFLTFGALKSTFFFR